MLEPLTFALAAIGYAGLTAMAIAIAHGRMPIRFWRVVVAIIAIHVALIWHVRYKWDIAIATQKGWTGFATFHAALSAIILSAAVNGPIRRVLIWLSFGAVTLGALGAVFMFDAVAVYRLPVALTALIGAIGLVHGWFGRMRPEDHLS